MDHWFDQQQHGTVHLHRWSLHPIDAINGNEIKLIADFNTWAYKGNNWLYGSHGVNKKPLEDTYGEEQNP